MVCSELFDALAAVAAGRSDVVAVVGQASEAQAALGALLKRLGATRVVLGTPATRVGEGSFAWLRDYCQAQAIHWHRLAIPQGLSLLALHQLARGEAGWTDTLQSRGRLPSAAPEWDRHAAGRRAMQRSIEGTGLTDALGASTRAFLHSLVGSGLAASTVEARARQLRTFVRFIGLQHVAAPQAVEEAHVCGFRSHVIESSAGVGACRKPATGTKILTATRLLLQWLAEDGQCDRALERLLPRTRVGAQPPLAILSEQEVDRVLAMPRLTTDAGLRDRALIELFYSSGLRRAEVADLDLADIDFDRAVVLVRNGKGGKPRLVPLGARCRGWLERYLEKVRARHAVVVGSPALFLTCRGRRLTPKALSASVKRYLLAAGVSKRGSCHLFRHAMATAMHDRGADVRDLQILLGHASLSTTQIYTHVSIRRLQQVHAETHPAEVRGGPLA